MLSVLKRNGLRQPADLKKITARIYRLQTELKRIDVDLLARKVYDGLYEGISTAQIDELAAETCAYMSTIHYQYNILAGRILMANLHKKTEPTFAAAIKKLSGLIDPELSHFTDVIDAQIKHERDFVFDFFAVKTLFSDYLLRVNGEIIERPQYMFMRVAFGIHKYDMDNALKTYHLMSQRYFTHASPTLFNAGTLFPQCSSCFVVSMTADSLDGIFDTLHKCGTISKYAGGIGLNVSSIRARGSRIAGTNGRSNGLMPMLRMFNAAARYVDQGGGKRKGAFAIYIEPWHADIFEVLDLKKNTGTDEIRARDLFYGLWITDLFMNRVSNNATWSLMCPHECPGLDRSHGAEFEALYTRYEKEGKFIRQIPAQELWFQILTTQVETGTPYMTHKDSGNQKSNQKNVYPNLCTEIMQSSGPDEIGVCNLASVALNAFVCDKGTRYDFELLHQVVAQVTRNLNRIIDINYYPLEETKQSNLMHRPIGIGVQGLADTFFAFKYPFDSPEAAKLNVEIFETIYHAACQTSMELACQYGAYSTFHESPASKGQLQFDLWGFVPPSNRYDWNALKANVQKHGLRNSLLTALMPTASTSQILGNVECFEPISSNLYTRTTLAGTFAVINRHLIDSLVERNLWTDEIRNAILQAKGSIQDIAGIPAHIKALYKTVWEIKQRIIVDMAAARGPYIDQSQSMNIHIAAPTFDQLTSLHFHAWRSGLKTGMYYLRTRPPVDPVQFTVCSKDCLSCQ